MRNYFLASTFILGFSSLSFANSIFTDGTRVFEADSSNNRVLIWKSKPTLEHRAPDVVLGQSSWHKTGASDRASGLRYPTHVNFIDAGGGLFKIFVTETKGCRIRVYNVTQSLQTLVAPKQSNSANYDIGTSAFIGDAAECVTTRYGLNGPRGTWTDGSSLVVADTGNNRVMIWNELPTTNNIPADIVLGQPDFTSNRANNEQGIIPSAQVMKAPTAAWFDGTKLHVYDHGNQRMLIWNSMPTTIQQPADMVIGVAAEE